MEEGKEKRRRVSKHRKMLATARQFNRPTHAQKGSTRRPRVNPTNVPRISTAPKTNCLIREPCRLARAYTGAELAMKVRPQQRNIIFGQAADEFGAEVIGAGRYGVAVALVVGRPALIDIFFEAIVQIFMLAAFRNFGLVVKLDLIHQQPGETLRLAMKVGIFRRHVRKRVGARAPPLRPPSPRVRTQRLPWPLPSQVPLPRLEPPPCFGA